MRLNKQYAGLTRSQVEESRRIHGINLLSEKVKTPWWKLLLKKFGDPLIVILLIAGIASIGISCYEYIVMEQGPGVFFEPAGIIMAIILATGLAFLFELKADKEFALLTQVNNNEPVTVIRNSHACKVPKQDIVVGDILILNTGEEIPADGELIEAVSLNVDESTLTGEPICSKTTDPERFDKDATFPSNRVLRGTKIMEGHGVMRVLAVGDHTEQGKVMQSAQIDRSVMTPLSIQLDNLGRLISKYAAVICVIVVIGRLITFFMQDAYDTAYLITYMLQTVMIAVSLMVVAVPEGLPMAVTLSLAYSMRRMLKTNNLVRNLHACETMGCVTTICTDKTGTLTQNRMQVAEMTFFGHPSKEIIYEGIAVNSTARLNIDGDYLEVLGNPTEGALLLWLGNEGLDYMELRSHAKVLDEITFTTERKYMATLVESSTGQKILYIKGAPEIVFAMCDVRSGVTSEELNAQLYQYQMQAMRTLGFAYAVIPDGQDVFKGDKIVAHDLTFLGIAAISDPVREDVPSAVAEVGEAGIAIKIVTGDTPGTAREIGRQIGLWQDDTDDDSNIITGPEFAALSDEEVYRRAEDIKIIARARPLDKKRLVEALQSHGEVVAVTGDGTNDAPALKAAHVGLSMGDGTAVAKEASDITIIDNSFASIGLAVKWGRSLYRNIQRFILFQLTVNVVACLIVMVGAFLGLESPLTVTQMLWVNLIMDTFAALGLSSLPPTDSVMRDKPRSQSTFIITPVMWRMIVLTGLLFFILLLGLLLYLEHTDINSLMDIGRVPIGEYHGLTPYELSLFFTIFVFLQFWNMFNAKAMGTDKSAFELSGCRSYLLVLFVILAGQVCIVELGGQFFNVVPLRLTDWLIIIGSTSIVLWIGELCRLCVRVGRAINSRRDSGV
ncbi:MAG: calcium-translocating P-type ATPase, PMCA-type [Muribaculaceae bacterium]|nr:calcium-translocating P-type ATPase, PMCA-type [Muribaculaceae bacterium]